MLKQFEDIELMLPKKVTTIDFSVLKTTLSWIYNRNCPNKSRIYIVLPDGTMFYRDHPLHRPHKKQKYFATFVFKDGSEKKYRMWRGVFIQFHLELYKYLDRKKAKTLSEANEEQNET